MIIYGVKEYNYVYSTGVILKAFKNKNDAIMYILNRGYRKTSYDDIYSLQLSHRNTSYSEMAIKEISLE